MPRSLPDRSHYVFREGGEGVEFSQVATAGIAFLRSRFAPEYNAAASEVQERSGTGNRCGYV